MSRFSHNLISMSSKSFAERAENLNLSSLLTAHNAGILLGAGVATGGLLYYMQQDEQSNADGADVKDQEARRRTKATYGHVLCTFARIGMQTCFIANMPFPVDLNPWMCLGASLATAVPLVIGTTMVDTDKHPTLKRVLWVCLHNTLTAGVCTLSMLGGPVVAHTFLATGCMVSGMSLLLSKHTPAPVQQNRAITGVGAGGVMAIALGNLFFPMSVLYNAALYGGLALLGGLMTVDAQRVYERARNSEFFDPIDESLAVWLDSVNIVRKIVVVWKELQKKDEKQGGDEAN